MLTVNNPEKTETEFFEYLKSLDDLKYFIFQREKGEEKGTEHYQVYIEFTQGKRFDYMKKRFPKAHIEVRQKSKKACRAYCSKKETRIGEVYEYGEFVEVGERSDITDMYSMIGRGASDMEIMQAYPSQYFHFYKNVEYIREKLMERDFKVKRRTDLEVTYIYGKTSVGKTSFVRDKYGDANVYNMIGYGEGHQRERFDGYCGQDVIIFDEFHSSIKINYMLQYIDIYPVDLPARFHDKTACYTKVFIISNIPIAEQYPNIRKSSRDTWDAFLRKIKYVYNFNESKDKPVPRSLWALRPLSKDDSEDLGF
jgi:RNA helicase./Putative viral replication protein.